MSSPLGDAILGASTFCAKEHGADECDGKGLPLTPHSINTVGRFRALLELDHPGLCAYLDIRRAKNERLIVVSECYDDCVENHIKSDTYSTVKSLCRLTYQVLDALAYLNDRGIVHRFLAPDAIMLTPKGDVKLHNYGLYYMTDQGKAVRFPIGFPRYMAPETIMGGPHSSSSSPKVDVWSLGMILLELFMATPVYPDLFLRNGLNPLLMRLMLLVQNYKSKGIHPVTALLESHNSAEKPIHSDLRSLLEACLSPLPSKRPSPSELLSHPFIVDMTKEERTQNGMSFVFLPSPFKLLNRCQSLDLDLPSYTHTSHSHSPHNLMEDHLVKRSLREVYYLWTLAGGEVETEMKKKGLIQSQPPICNLPCLVTNGGEEYGLGRSRVTLYDGTLLFLSLDQLRKRLEGMTTMDYYPLMDSGTEEESSQAQQRHESSTLPLAIKERDVEYQFHRMVVFTRLLESYPHSHERIITEAIVDICPLVRAEVWAALLGVKGDIHGQYAAIDKDGAGLSDRQIDVDIPRCHQYSTLLASREGHKKFKRILKAWIRSHPRLVYWQGLDSLCAPFLALNFNNEALAYACLTAFISKYLHKFFLKDNSPIMQEYLAVFSQMIAFHEPQLFNHLDSIAFHADLYAIPWFLTMFTHILPLNKIFYLWDTLLLGNSSFPIFVGVSILQHLKDDLLSFDFNECILMFSDMPDIDIQGCVHDAVKAYQTTPPSAYLRKYEHTLTQPSSVPPEALREPLPLSLLRQESCPHISAHDLIRLCKLEYQALGYGGGARSDDSTHSVNPLMRRVEDERRGRERKGGRKGEKAVIVDIRSLEEFRLGHVPGSLNLPHTSAFQPDGSLTSTAASSSLLSLRGKAVVIVVANKGESGPVFARQLVRLNFPSVCVLHNGAGVLRSLGLFTSLGDDR